MLTIPRPTHHLGQLVGTGFVLVSLFGCLTVPAESVAGFEPTEYRGYRRDGDSWNHHDYRKYREHRRYQDYRSYRRPRSEHPDRFIIRKGKKCQIRCERVWGTRGYRCREYRC
jgi:hypothetical protein